MTDDSSNQYPSQAQLLNQLDGLSARLDDIGDHAADLLHEWRQMEGTGIAHLLAAFHPAVVQAIYNLEIAIFRESAERAL